VGAVGVSGESKQWNVALVNCNWLTIAVLPLLAICYSAAQDRTIENPGSSPQLQVNWLYGAYVPKDAPLEPLTAHQRFRLYLRQTFTTPGIYVKTILFSVGDQINDSPPGWEGDLGGYARRVASRQAQFVLQNSFSALGNGLLSYEPRYDRCRCSGLWGRTGHAIKRNFLTYDRTERASRPQFASYIAAFAAGVTAGTWKPTDHELAAEGYRGVITQAVYGTAANLLGEFTPDLIKKLKSRHEDIIQGNWNR
jgi:hypothetical protein